MNLRIALSAQIAPNHSMHSTVPLRGPASDFDRLAELDFLEISR